MTIAGIGEADMCDRSEVAPGAPFDDEAGGAFGNVEARGGLALGGDGADLVLGRAPWHLIDQPRSRRQCVEIDLSRLRYGVEIDDAVFQTERPAAGVVNAGDVQHRDRAGKLQPPRILGTTLA